MKKNPENRSKVIEKGFLLTISTMTKLAVVAGRSVEKISFPKTMVFGTLGARERGTVQLFLLLNFSSFSVGYLPASARKNSTFDKWRKIYLKNFEVSFYA